jgi:hypothetical protein
LGLDATDDINNFVAGFGDAGTFGLSRYLRERAGCNATTFFGRSVNSGSGFYTGGEATLTTASLVTGGAGLVKSGFKVGLNRLSRQWSFGSFKSAAKWANQTQQRGWTPQQITETIKTGKIFTASNKINPKNIALRFENTSTGKSVVIDLKTKEILQLGGEGFKF